MTPCQLRCRPVRLALLSLLLSLTLAPAAAAAPLQKAIWGPAKIGEESQFPRYRALGVTLWQTGIWWHEVARERPRSPTDPADPAYRWPERLDAAVADARRHGISVLIVLQGTPGWANAGKGESRPPHAPRDYADFAAAAARRYPDVRHWMIWGEPLRNLNYPGTSTRPDRLKIGRVYARMLDGAYGALKRVSRRNMVIGGNSYTTARKPAVWAPVPLYEWMRSLRLPNGRPPRMDLWGHNPFTVRRPSLRNGPGASLGDISDLRRVLARLQRYVGRPQGRRLRLFISEFCLPTGKNDVFPLSLTQRQQADWLRRAWAIARGERLVWGFGWFQLLDDVPPEASQRNTCGLIDASGRRKLAYSTFRRVSPQRRG